MMAGRVPNIRCNKSEDTVANNDIAISAPKINQGEKTLGAVMRRTLNVPNDLAFAWFPLGVQAKPSQAKWEERFRVAHTPQKLGVRLLRNFSSAVPFARMDVQEIICTKCGSKMRMWVHAWHSTNRRLVMVAVPIATTWIQKYATATCSLLRQIKSSPGSAGSPGQEQAEKTAPSY